MKFRMWGVRGSIPTPGENTRKYGGNTTCIEVRTDDDVVIILDAGTGIFPLAQTLLPKMPLDVNLFITHTHWDHIQGLPFFTPIFVPGNTITIYGARDIVSGQGVEQAMAVQLQYSFFPVREAELNANLEYRTVNIGEPVTVGDAVITGTMLNHPVINLGYRIDCNGKSLFFTGDHEPYVNIYEPGDSDYAEYQRVVDERQEQVDDAMRSVDVLIADCSFKLEEYPPKIGWGHGTFDHAIEMARRTGAGKLVCTHHEPTRSDDDLEQAFDEVMSRYPRGANHPEVILAYEGLEVDIE